MILISTRRISRPRKFIPIYDDGEYTERISSVTGEKIKVTNKYYMIDDVGGDFIISKVLFVDVGCVVINDSDRVMCYKGKYKEKYGGIKEEDAQESPKRRTIRDFALSVKNLFLDGET